MSVLASQRGISDMEFYKNAIEMKNKLVLLLLRNFGFKNIEEATEWEQWYVNFEREKLLNLSSAVVNNIVYANNIYVYTQKDYEQRRYYQNTAINSVYNILEEFAHLHEVFKVQKIQKHLELFIQMADRELVLLKSWRKKTKKPSSSTKKPEFDVETSFNI